MRIWASCKIPSAADAIGLFAQTPGSVKIASEKTGVILVTADPQTLECDSGHPFRIIKPQNNAHNPPSLSPINPRKVGPKHHSIEFENNDQARRKTGDARLDESMTRNEQNPLDHSSKGSPSDLK